MTSSEPLPDALPDPTPQPRDIALEQETPELADELEAQSEPDPGAGDRPER